MKLQPVSIGDHPYPVTTLGHRDNAALRAWAWRNQIYIAEFGPIPHKVYEAFRARYQRQIDRAPMVKVIEI